MSGFDDIQNRFEGLVRHLLRAAEAPSRQPAQSYWIPAVDVYETAAHFVILVDLAGVDHERIDVTLQGSRLTLSGERREPHCPDAKQHLHQVEIDYGRFQRVIELPEVARPESVEARYDRGFLQIRVARTARTRSVQVEPGPDRD